MRTDTTVVESNIHPPLAAGATRTTWSCRVTCGRETDRSSTVSWCRSKSDFGEQRPSRAKEADESGGKHGHNGEHRART